MDAKVAGFRDRYRRERISLRYRGWLHFAFTTLGALAAIVGAIAQVEGPVGAKLLVVPGTFLFANFVEYRVHRGPMHHRTRFLGLLFKRHTLEHHRFFTSSCMQHQGSRDFAAVLFPPVMLIFFLGCIAAPVGVLLHVLLGQEIGWLFVASVVSYFLNYELLHFAYHQPEDAWVSKLPLMATLRALHTKHHDATLMASANFNITYPIFDWMYRTYRR